MAYSFVPSADYLEKVRAKKSFLLVITGNYKNEIYEAWDKYTVKKALELTNIVMYKNDPKRDSCAEMGYWVKIQDYALEIIAAYMKKNPEVKNRIYM